MAGGGGDGVYSEYHTGARTNNQRVKLRALNQVVHTDTAVLKILKPFGTGIFFKILAHPVFKM